MAQKRYKTATKKESRTKIKTVTKKKRRKIKFTHILFWGIVLCLGWLQIIHLGNQTQNPATGIENHQKEAFIKKVATVAKSEQRRSHVLASITIAQAALESDWGKSELATKYNNLFGVKAEPNQRGEYMTTKEYVNGQWITVSARFMVYDSWNESIQAHTQLLVNGTTWNHSHYAAVIQAKNYQEAAQALQEKGYATDPQYAQKLINLIKAYHLDRYDY